MRLNIFFIISLLFGIAAAGVIGDLEQKRGVDPAVREAEDGGVDQKRAVEETVEDDEQDNELDDEDLDLEGRDPETLEELWKRRGGGGGGGRGGGGGKSGSKGGNSGNKGSNSNSAARNNPSNYPNTLATSNTGGFSPKGTGPQPRFASNSYYGGGAKVPFVAGKETATRNVKPTTVTGGLPYYPGYWPPYPIFIYPYSYNHAYYNKTSKKNEKREVICACAQYSTCMCDDIDDTKFWKELIKDGDYKELNKSLVTVNKVDGKTKIILNGTLPNGTTVKCTNSDDCEDYYTGSASSLFAHTIGFWPAIAIVMGTVFLT